jgi:hypothetical protein
MGAKRGSPLPQKHRRKRLTGRDLLNHYKASIHILGKQALLKPEILSHFLQVWQDMTRNLATLPRNEIAQGPRSAAISGNGGTIQCRLDRILQ